MMKGTTIWLRPLFKMDAKLPTLAMLHSTTQGTLSCTRVTQLRLSLSRVILTNGAHYGSMESNCMEAQLSGQQ